MTTHVRALFTRGAEAPKRSGLVRATVIPSPLLTAPGAGDALRAQVDAAVVALPPAPLSPAMLRVVERLRAEAVPAPRCAAPSCPRRQAFRSRWCKSCGASQPKGHAAELVAAGWSCEKVARRYRWRDPSPGGGLHPTREAVKIAKRDAARDAAKAGAP